MNIPSANTDAWNAAEGKRNNKTSLIRYRPNLEKHLGTPNYSQRLIIIWAFNENDHSGMPSAEQSDEMRIFENAIVDVLDPDRSAILVLVITNAGEREWHFYVQDIADIGQKINEVLSGFPKLPITLQVEDDADWDELRQVYRMCR